MFIQFLMYKAPPWLEFPLPETLKLSLVEIYSFISWGICTRCHRSRKCNCWYWILEFWIEFSSSNWIFGAITIYEWFFLMVSISSWNNSKSEMLYDKRTSKNYLQGWLTILDILCSWLFFVLNTKANIRDK